MSRNGSGVYSLPAGSTITNGDTSDATDLNTPLTDIASDLNVARPVVAGGTGSTTASGARTALGLAIGTDVQAYDAGLASIAGLTTAADKMVYTTALDTYAVADLTAAGRALLDDAAASDQRTTLGLGTAAVVDVIDEDSFATDSATRPPSQQSTKAYVDANNTPILAVLEDQKSSGTAAASITANTWTTRELNTEVRDVNSVITLTSNEFVSTVDAWVEWSAPGTDTFSTRLYNVTDAVEVAKGQSLALGSVYYSLSTGGAAITAGKTYAIQQNQSATRNAGAAASDGTEVYTRVKIFAN